MFCCTCADKSQTVEATDVEVRQAKTDMPFALTPAIAAAAIEELGEAQVEKPFVEAKPVGRSIHVCVVEACGLRNADLFPGSGKSDAFVQVEAAGSSFQTKVVKDSLQPVWQHEGELAPVPNGAVVDFTVWDQDPVGKQLLGRAQLTPEQYEKEGFNGELLLSEAGAGVKAYLKVKVKVPGKEYPQGQPAEFQVTLDKPAGGSLGLDIDLLDGLTLHVTNVKEGMLAEWNASHPPELRVAAGYFITEVNGVSGNTSLMVARFKEDNKIKLSVRRPREFPISIVKKNGQLGLDLNYAANGSSLLVLKVNDGPVSEWNKTYPHATVRRSDRIVSVNGRRGTSKDLHEAMASPEKLNLVVARPAADEA